jgi:Beta-ketoacyl synthase, N-terminal domain
MSSLRVWVQGAGLLGPGMTSWSASQETLRGTQAYEPAATVLPQPQRLPPAERRRAGAAVKLALAVADEAVVQSQLDPATLATVFTSSSGEGTNCHALCEALALPAPVISPTRFTNSVHNAASGCWHIATASRASSTSLCAFDGSFGAGLIEAAASVRSTGEPLLLVASDSPYPEPLNATRPLPDHFGLALVFTAMPNDRSLASLDIELTDAQQPLSACDNALLDALRRAIPAAAGLPLMAALAQARPQRLVLEYLDSMHLQIEVGFA